MTSPVPSLLVTATVLAVSSLTIMANATIAPSLPGLAAAFADTPGIETLAGAVLSLPSLAIILSAGLFGWLADRVDRRRLLPIVMVVYALGGASGAVASSMSEILAGRIFLGLGVAGVMTLSTMLAADLWQGEARARFMGRQGAAISAGGIVFLLLGGALAEVSWREPFLIYLVALPLAALAYAVLPGNGAKDDSTPGGSAPMPWGIVARIGGLAFFAMVMFYTIPTRLPFLLVELGITAPSASGLAIAAMTAAGLPMALLYGQVRAHLSPARIFAISFAFMATGYLLISFAGGFVMVIVGTMVAGLGLGLLMPNQNNWLMGEVPEDARGRAAGALTTLVFAGQFTAPFVAGLLVQVITLGQVFAAFAGMLALSGLVLWRVGKPQEPAPD